MAFAAGALVTLGALGAVLLARTPGPEAPPSPAPTPTSVASEAPSPPPREAESLAPAPPAKAGPEPAEPRADAALVALEDQALRRIDVVAVLEREGIDSRELRARPDGEDLVRHLAADELLTLLFMRQLFSQRVYPPDYPRAAALAECRAVAEGVVAELTPEDRVKYLAAELALPAAPPPSPVYVPTP
jgi:hypothetical protein